MHDNILTADKPKLFGRKYRHKRVKPMNIRMEKLTAMFKAEVAMTEALNNLSAKERQVYNEVTAKAKNNVTKKNTNTKR